MSEFVTKKIKVSLICHRIERKWIVLVTQVVWGILSNKKI